MKLLDWYIFKKLITAIIFTCFIFTVIVVVIDIVEKIDAFRRMKPTTGEIFRDFYLNYIPYLINIVSPILVFIATIFVTAQLASRTEITAILSSGVTFNRFMRPYLIAAVLLSGITFYMTGWLIPDANKIRIAFDNQHIRDSKYRYDKRNTHLGIAPGVYAYIETYDNYNNTGYKFTLEKMKGSKLVEKLEADRIQWDSTKRKWKIENYWLREFDEKNNMKQKLSYIKTPIDTTLNLQPNDFQDMHLHNEKLTLDELNRYIALLEQRGSEEVQVYIIEKYSRFTYPFAVIILMIFAVLMSSKKNRRGIGGQIAAGFVIAFVYVMLYYLMTKGIAKNSSMPMLMVWMPNIIFSTLAFILYRIIILQDERLKKIVTLQLGALIPRRPIRLLTKLKTSEPVEPL